MTKNKHTVYLLRETTKEREKPATLDTGLLKMLALSHKAGTVVEKRPGEPRPQKSPCWAGTHLIFPSAVIHVICLNYIFPDLTFSSILRK